MYHIIDGWARHIWHCAVATLMAGSCLTGVFRIAGTYMPYTGFFLAVSGILLILAVVSFIAELQSCREI